MSRSRTLSRADHGRRTTAGTLARVLRSEDVRDTIPRETTLKGGRVVYGGELREAQDNLLVGLNFPASSTQTYRSAVTLRRDWYLVGVAIMFPRSMVLAGGALLVTVRASVYTPRGKFTFSNVTGIDPTTLPDLGTVTFLGPLGGRADVDVLVENTTLAPVTKVSGLVVSAWGSNATFSPGPSARV